MSKPLSKLFLLLVALAVMGGLVYAFWPQPLLVDLGTVERGALRVTVDEDGKTRIREKYVVSAPLAGRLLRIEMKPGDRIAAGDTLLATIRPRDPELLDARTIAQSEARVRASGAALERSGTMLRQAMENQADAERDLQRIRQLSQTRVATRSELEDAELLLRIRGEELRSAKLAEEIARFELQQAEAALLRSRPREEPHMNSGDNGSVISNGSADPLNGGTDAVTELDPNNGWNFTIFSPIDGRVLRVFQESAAVVTAGTPLLELGDPSDLEVEVDVLSSDAVSIEPGAAVVLEHWGGQRPLEGRVRLIEPAAFTKISTLGVEEQRVYVIIDLLDPPSERSSLGDGFRVEARIVTAEVDNALRVPTSAMFRVGDRWAVFREEDGQAVQQIVEIGRQNGLMGEVLQGLSEGDRVILHPSDQIADGIRIQQRAVETL